MSTTPQISCPRCRATPLILLQPTDDDTGPIKYRHGTCFHCKQQVRRVKRQDEQPLPKREWRHREEDPPHS